MKQETLELLEDEIVLNKLSHSEKVGTLNLILYQLNDLRDRPNMTYGNKVEIEKIKEECNQLMKFIDDPNTCTGCNHILEDHNLKFENMVYCGRSGCVCKNKVELI